MECPECGAENPDYVVYCCSCSALLKKPRYRGDWKFEGSPIVIEDEWTRFKRLLMTAVTLALIAAAVVTVLWLCTDYLLRIGYGVSFLI